MTQLGCSLDKSETPLCFQLLHVEIEPCMAMSMRTKRSITACLSVRERRGSVGVFGTEAVPCASDHKSEFKKVARVS